MCILSPQPGKDKTSPKTPSAVTPPEETANERTPPPVPTASAKPTFDLSGPSVTQDEGTNEMKSLPPVPPASTKPVVDAGLPPAGCQGTTVMKYH